MSDFVVKTSGGREGGRG